MPADQRQTTVVDLTTSSILKFFAFIIVLALLWFVRNVVAIVLFSIVLAAAIGPVVDTLNRRRVPRALGITLMYMTIIAVIVVAVYLFGQLVSDQIRGLASNFPDIYGKVMDTLFGNSNVSPAIAQTAQRWLQSLNSTLVNLTKQVVVGTFSLFGGLFTFIGVLVLSFYMVLQKDSLKRLVDAVSPVNYIPYFYQLTDRITERLGGWVRGQLLISASIAILTYITLLIVGIDYAIALALIAGLMEFIPYLGPFIGAVPAVLVAFGQSPILALVVIVVYLVNQQVQNSIIVPKIVQRTTGINPIVSIVVVLIGGKLAGIAGIVLALPITIIIDAFFQDFFKETDGAHTNDQPEGDV